MTTDESTPDLSTYASLRLNYGLRLTESPTVRPLSIIGYLTVTAALQERHHVLDIVSLCDVASNVFVVDTINPLHDMYSVEHIKNCTAFSVQ